MSHHSDLDLQLQEVDHALQEPSPADLVELKLAGMLNDLDDLIATSLGPRSALLDGQLAAVSTIVTRAQLLLSFLEVQERPAGKVVRFRR